MTDPLTILIGDDEEPRNPGMLDHFRDIPTLVAALEDGKAENIFAFRGSYPDEADVTQAIVEMGPGRVLLMFQGTLPFRASDAAERWQHLYLFAIKPKTETHVPEAQRRGASKIWTEMMNGAVTSWGGLNIRQRPVYRDAVDLMGPPTVRLRTLALSQKTRVDYFEGTITLIERGDP